MLESGEKSLIDEIYKYLDAVDVFRAEKCEPEFQMAGEFRADKQLELDVSTTPLVEHITTLWGIPVGNICPSCGKENWANKNQCYWCDEELS